jgi:hypothetical protein
MPFISREAAGIVWMKPADEDICILIIPEELGGRDVGADGGREPGLASARFIDTDI